MELKRTTTIRFSVSHPNVVSHIQAAKRREKLERLFPTAFIDVMASTQMLISISFSGSAANDAPTNAEMKRIVETIFGA